jgi:hypothetical protein
VNGIVPPICDTAAGIVVPISGDIDDPVSRCEGRLIQSIYRKSIAARPQFDRATGYKLVFLFAGTPGLIRQATSGVPFDLGVVPIDVMSDAAAQAKFAAQIDRYFPRRLRGRLQERHAGARCWSASGHFRPPEARNREEQARVVAPVANDTK